MSEKRFLNCVFTEGFLLTVFGILLLIVPKITDVSFGFMLSLILVVYGGYKCIMSFLSRSIEPHYILNIVNSLILFVCGILIFVGSYIDMTIITALLGIYFILQSLASGVYINQAEEVFVIPKYSWLLPFIQFTLGIIIITLLPVLWVGGVFLGLNFIILGVYLLNLYLSKKYF